MDNTAQRVCWFGADVLLRNECEESWRCLPKRFNQAVYESCINDCLAGSIQAGLDERYAQIQATSCPSRQGFCDPSNTDYKVSKLRATTENNFFKLRISRFKKESSNGATTLASTVSHTAAILEQLFSETTTTSKLYAHMASTSIFETMHTCTTIILEVSVQLKVETVTSTSSPRRLDQQEHAVHYRPKWLIQAFPGRVLPSLVGTRLRKTGSLHGLDSRAHHWCGVFRPLRREHVQRAGDCLSMRLV